MSVYYLWAKTHARTRCASNVFT